jgi:hypothetical protein
MLPEIKTSDLKCLLYDETKSATGSPQTTSAAFDDVTVVTRASAKQNTRITKYRGIALHLHSKVCLVLHITYVLRQKC